MFEFIICSLVCHGAQCSTFSQIWWAQCVCVWLCVATIFKPDNIMVLVETQIREIQIVSLGRACVKGFIWVDRVQPIRSYVHDFVYYLRK